MNRLAQGLLVATFSLLASCSDESTAAGGGTGSDFPVHPAIAVVQKPDGAMVHAEAWRLWSVSPDSMQYAMELSPTDNGGFQLPDTGSWIVEAWGNTTEAGKSEGLRKLPIDASFERCLNWIGRNLSSTSPSPAILGACRELTSPTVVARGGVQNDPRAVAAFRLPNLASPSATLADSTGKSLPTRAWRLWKQTQDTTGPWKLFSFGGFQSASENGSIELAGLSGTWVAEGWDDPPQDSLYRLPPRVSGLDKGLLELCLGDTPSVAPRVCTEPLFDATLYDTGVWQLPLPDVVVVFRLP